MTSKSFESYRFERAMTAILQNVGFHDCTGQKHKCERFRKCKNCSTQKRRARDWFQPRSAVSSEPKFREEWSSYPQIQPRLRNANFSIRGEKCLWRPCRRIVSLFWTKDFAQNVLGVFVLATSWVFSAESLHPVAVLPCRRGDRPSRRKRMHMMLMMRLANKYPYIIINIYIWQLKLHFSIRWWLWFVDWLWAWLSFHAICKWLSLIKVTRHVRSNSCFVWAISQLRGQNNQN